MLLNCGVGEDSWESLGLPGDPTSQSLRKSVLNSYWEGMMLKMKLQYFGHLMQGTDSLEKTLILGKAGEGDNRGWEDWMASLPWWTGVWASCRSYDRQGSPACCSPWGSKELDMTESLNWTEWSENLLCTHVSNCTNSGPGLGKCKDFLMNLDFFYPSGVFSVKLFLD